MFLGANIDAIEVAGRFGIGASHAVTYEHDSIGTQLNFEVMSKVVSRVRKACSVSEMEAVMEDDQMLEPVREDYRRRHAEGRPTKHSR